jgi:uncharacterized protein
MSIISELVTNDAPEINGRDLVSAEMIERQFWRREKYRISAGLFCLLIAAWGAGARGQSSARTNGTVPLTAMTGSETEIQQAARAGDLALLQSRLQQGVPPDSRNPSGRTALLEAAAAGQIQAIRELLAHGAGVNVASPDGQTPLIEAARNGRTDIARMLVKADADLNARSRGYGTALEAAERYGHDNIATLLRSAGAHTFGRSVGDTVCVRPWQGGGYCGTVEGIKKNNYQIRVTKIVGCLQGCEPKAECSAGKLVGGTDGLKVGDSITTRSWCLTHTGVRP